MAYAGKSLGRYIRTINDCRYQVFDCTTDTLFGLEADGGLIHHHILQQQKIQVQGPALLIEAALENEMYAVMLHKAALWTERQGISSFQKD